MKSMEVDEAARARAMKYNARKPTSLQYDEGPRSGESGMGVIIEILGGVLTVLLFIILVLESLSV